MGSSRVPLLCAAAILASIGLAGCTVRITGEATASFSLPSSTSSAPPNSGTKTQSSRPREVKIDGLDPCALLSPDQLRRFKIDVQPRPDTDTTFQAPTCNFFSTSTRTGFRLTPIATFGIERFESGKVTGKVVPKVIQGFPALQNHIAGASEGHDFCSVTIDVANGRVVDVMFTEDGNKQQPLTTEAVCQRANEGADAVMTTLLAR